MISKPKALLSVAMASAFLLAGCSSDETPRLSGPGSTTSPNSSASPAEKTSSPSSSASDKSGSKTVKSNGKEVETYGGITPMPDDGVLTPDEQAKKLKAENERIDNEDKGRPVSSVSVESGTKNQAIDLYTSYTAAVKESDYEKACSYIYPGENNSPADCVAYFESLPGDFDPKFDFENSNSVKMTTTGDIIFQQETAPTEGETVPRLTFTEREGKLLLSLPVG